jgi:hypothetical protein
MEFGANRARMAQARLLSRSTTRPEPGQVNRQSLPADIMVKRERKLVVKTQHVSMAPSTGTGVKAKQAWKYPGGNIVRASGTLINGRYYTDPKNPVSEHLGKIEKDMQGQSSDRELGTPRRKQESNFFITINPNQVWSGSSMPAALEAEAKRRFQDALDHLHKNDTFARILKFGPKDDHYINDKAHDVLIPGVEWTSVVEVGEQKHRMHGHISIYMYHYSQVQINPKMLQHEFRAVFNKGLLPTDRLFIKKLPYVHVGMLKQNGWKDIMRQYLEKGMQVGLA